MKNKIAVLVVGLIFVFIFVYWLRNRQSNEIRSDISDMIGKQIDIRELCDSTVSGKIKIVSYFDSVSCVSCRLEKEILFWDQFMESVDTLNADVELFFIFEKISKHRLSYLEHDRYNVIVDSLGIYSSRYAFPKKLYAQCFLLNSNNKVVLVGHPFNNDQVRNLYYKYILENR